MERAIKRYILIFFLSSIILSVPKFSVITSLYKADKYLESFLDDVVKQTIFDECELILINAGSSGKEDEIVQKYLGEYKNIKYIHLDSDPGLYAVWNLGISKAEGEYITNLNVDDRIDHTCYEIFINFLESHKDVDLVYASYYVTHKSNETFEDNSACFFVDLPGFSHQNMMLSLPNFFPMWKKSIHKTVGFFDVSYQVAGDWEFWLRMVDHGMQFRKVDKALGLYFKNPKGLSTKQDQSSQRIHFAERKKIFNCYQHLWTYQTFEDFSKQFNKMCGWCTFNRTPTVSNNFQ